MEVEVNLGFGVLYCAATMNEASAFIGSSDSRVALNLLVVAISAVQWDLQEAIDVLVSVARG